MKNTNNAKSRAEKKNAKTVGVKIELPADLEAKILIIAKRRGIKDENEAVITLLREAAEQGRRAKGRDADF